MLGPFHFEMKVNEMNRKFVISSNLQSVGYENNVLEIELHAGDFIRVAPAAKRQFFAGDDSAISFVCIQVQEHSLEGYTAADAVIAE